MRFRLLVLALLVVSLLGLASCGDDDAAPDEPTTTEDAATDDDSAADDSAAEDGAAEDGAPEGALLAEADVDGDGIVAVVDGVEITEDELAEELAVVRDDFRWQVEEDSQPLDRGSVTFHFGAVESVDELMAAPFHAEAVAGIIDRLVDDTLVTAALERLGGEVTADDRLAAAEQSLRDAESPYFDREVQRFARQLALGRALVDTPAEVTDDLVQRAYELALARDGAVCVRHILLATADDAQFIVDQLEAGTDFGSTAEAVSLDPTTAADGGEIGCLTRGSLPPDLAPFEAAAWSAEPGEIVGPVETDRGFHVIEVTGFEPSLEDARDVIVTSADLLAVAWVAQARADAAVDLDESRGTWDPAGIGPPTAG